MNQNEECDDQNMVQGDGCFDCKKETGYICDGTPSVCTLCGNGNVDENEECDDKLSTEDLPCSNCKINQQKIDS